MKTKNTQSKALTFGSELPIIISRNELTVFNYHKTSFSCLYFEDVLYKEEFKLQQEKIHLF